MGSSELMGAPETPADAARDVEAALIGRLLSEPPQTAEIVSGVLVADHFRTAAHRVLFGAVVEAFYADEPIDPLVLGELHAKTLAKLWQTDERAAVARVVEMAETARGNPLEHAKVVKRAADYRRIARLGRELLDHATRQDRDVEELTGMASDAALEVEQDRSDGLKLIHFSEIGKEFERNVKTRLAYRESGMEEGVYFGLRAFDDWLHGLKGGELLIIGGEPGAGKSAVIFQGALNYAARQEYAPVPEGGKRQGTLIASMEMGPEPTSDRFATMIGSDLNGSELREGKITQGQLLRVLDEFRQRENLPLWISHEPTFRTSKLRAVITNAALKHNTGLVVIDHFRMFDLDRRRQNPNDEDEEKVRFLKEEIALKMNCAVVCLAHTRKPDQSSNGRPRMSDLRGSGQIAAHADFVGFVYRPWMYATDEEKANGEVDRKDAEMIWVKNRHGDLGNAHFVFDAAYMRIMDPVSY